MPRKFKIQDEMITERGREKEEEREERRREEFVLVSVEERSF